MYVIWKSQRRCVKESGKINNREWEVEGEGPPKGISHAGAEEKTTWNQRQSYQDLETGQVWNPKGNFMVQSASQICDWKQFSIWKDRKSEGKSCFNIWSVRCGSWRIPIRRMGLQLHANNDYTKSVDATALEESMTTYCRTVKHDENWNSLTKASRWLLAN